MIQLSSTRRLAILYIKQHLFIKQPLLFLSFNYLNAPSARPQSAF